MWHNNARRKSNRTFTWSVRSNNDTLSPTPDHGTRQACIAFTFKGPRASLGIKNRYDAITGQLVPGLRDAIDITEGLTESKTIHEIFWR